MTEITDDDIDVDIKIFQWKGELVYQVSKYSLDNKNRTATVPRKLNKDLQEQIRRDIEMVKNFKPSNLIYSYDRKRGKNSL